jgi:outer membrane protein assembly factor BamE (lipoprotein component of BamABCDE complex)
MSYRTVLMSAVLAAGTGIAGLTQADIVAVDSGVAVKESDGIAPARGMTMSQVASKFGAPVTKVPAVGNPPISRWEYPGFVVYFERDHVIHSVVSESAAPPPAAAPAPAESPSGADSTRAPAAPAENSPAP